MFRALFARPYICALLIVLCFGVEIFLPSIGLAQAAPPKPGEAMTEKASKTYAEALTWKKNGATEAAIRSFLSANKQDDGHCVSCLNQVFNLAFNFGDYKD